MLKQVLRPGHADNPNGSLVGCHGNFGGVGNEGGALHNPDLTLLSRWLVKDGHGELRGLAEDLHHLGTLLMSLQGGKIKMEGREGKERSGGEQIIRKEEGRKGKEQR